MSKRMLSTNIVESDVFLDMPLSSQSLYFHLNMNADNDGFVNPKRIMRMIGAAGDDLQILVAKRFILMFDSGIAVIKHWWINNTKRSDRHVPTTYQNELNELYLKDNKSYTKNTTQLAILTDKDLDEVPFRQPNAEKRVPQYNAIQDNTSHVQDNTNQPNSEKPEGFKKTIKTKEQKRNYAKAVQADKALEQKEQHAIGRPKGYSTFATAGELLKKRKLGEQTL